MSMFGVRVNGQLRITGVGLVTTATNPGTGFASPSANNVSLYTNGTAQFLAGSGILRMNNATLFGWASGSADGTAQDTILIRQAANTVEFFDGSTNASTVLLGSVDFRQTASTFAQTATITNGPRAANPVAWVECKVLGTTGRIPVW